MSDPNSPACKRGASQQQSQSLISGRTPRHYWRGCHAALVAVLLFSACAAPDPYARLTPAAPREVSVEVLVDAFNNRWPQRFKCTQTVVLDFGPVTRTFVGYLAVERPDRFRLQGMTEQGVKMFDLAHNEHNGDVVVMVPTDGMGEQALRSVSRDIQRVFLEQVRGAAARYDGVFQHLDARLDAAKLRGRLAGDPAKVDRYEACDGSGGLYRLDHYEWTPDLAYPTVLVLRDSGRYGGIAYKLTLRITDLKVVDKPFPVKTFFPGTE